MPAQASASPERAVLCPVCRLKVATIARDGGDVVVLVAHKRREVRFRNPQDLVITCDRCDASFSVLPLPAVLSPAELTRAEEAARFSRLPVLGWHLTPAAAGAPNDATITSANKAAELLYGYARAELVGHSLTMLLSPHFSQPGLAVLARLAAGEVVGEFRDIRRHRSGHLLYVAVTMSIVRQVLDIRVLTQARRIDREHPFSPGK